MSDAIPDTGALIADLTAADFNVRALALARLVERGRTAAPALTAALAGADAASKALLAQALAEIGDPANANVFESFLDDADERVRAHGAQGLARIGDPRAAAALVRTLDDFPDVLRQPYTLSAYGLIDLGRAALPQLLPLLDAPSPTTRERAFLVLHDIIAASPDVDDWGTLWRALGRFEPDGPEPQRRLAVQRWREWVSQRAPGS